MCGGRLGEPAISAPDRLHGTPGVHQVAVCLGCGGGVTLPRVGEAGLAGFYPAGYGPHDERLGPALRLVSRAVRRFQGWNALRSRPIAELRGRAPDRGLDVGCGRGDLAAALMARGWTMDGIEPSPGACAAAQQHGVNARCGTLATVPLSSGVYDFALFRHSLEHTGDPVAALRAVARALVPDGLVLISVPNFGGRQARRYRDCWYHLDLPRHRVHFTARALERALLEAGLEPVSISTSTSSMGLPASLQYSRFGRCLFPSGLRLRLALAFCVLALPVAIAYDRREGDTLHAVARLADRSR